MLHRISPLWLQVSCIFRNNVSIAYHNWCRTSSPSYLSHMSIEPQFITPFCMNMLLRVFKLFYNIQLYIKRFCGSWSSSSVLSWAIHDGTQLAWQFARHRLHFLIVHRTVLRGMPRNYQKCGYIHTFERKSLGKPDIKHLHAWTPL